MWTAPRAMDPKGSWDSGGGVDKHKLPNEVNWSSGMMKMFSAGRSSENRRGCTPLSVLKNTSVFYKNGFLLQYYLIVVSEVSKMATFSSRNILFAVSTIYYTVTTHALYLSPREFNSSACRCIPGDSSWPSSTEWAKLNATVGGRLIKTTPLASPCHDPNYDAEQCATLKNLWPYPNLQFVAQYRPCPETEF